MEKKKSKEKEQKDKKENDKEKEEENNKKKEKFNENSKKNNSEENQILEGNQISEESQISDDKLIKKFSDLGNNKQRKNIPISVDIEKSNTNYTSINITNNEISNYKDFQNDKILYNELLILNEKGKQIQTIKLRLKFLKNIFTFIENYVFINFGFNLKYYCSNNIWRINLKTNEIFNFNIKDLLLAGLSCLNPKEKNDAKKEYELICKMENENKKIKCKVLNIFFSEKLGEKYKMYLNDCFYLKNGNAKFLLKEFPTYKDDFNDYNPEQRLNIKNCICFLSDFEIIKDNNKTQQIKIKHYNSRRAIIKKGIQSIYSEINDFSLDKYGIRLYVPTLKNKLGKRVSEYKEYFKNNPKYIFSNLKPRRNKQDKDYSSKIDELLKKEEEEEDEENRILSQLLNLGNINYNLRAFVNDERVVKIKYDNGSVSNLYLPNMKTFRDCFDYLPKDIQDAIKKDFIDLLDGKKKSRKSSELRNSKLKNNKNLTGRKRNRNN